MATDPAVEAAMKELGPGIDRREVHRALAAAYEAEAAELRAMNFIGLSKQTTQWLRKRAAALRAGT